MGQIRKTLKAFLPFVATVLLMPALAPLAIACGAAATPTPPLPTTTSVPTAAPAATAAAVPTTAPAGVRPTVAGATPAPPTVAPPPTATVRPGPTPSPTPVVLGLTLVKQWGGPGIGEGQFSSILAITVDRAGNVYVLDRANRPIQKFSANGDYLGTLGAFGNKDGQFYIDPRVGYGQPNDIAIDSAGNIYVMCVRENLSEVQKFDSAGVFLGKWGTHGAGDGQFSSPQGVAVDAAGNVYVADSGNNRVQKFGPNGAFLAKWGLTGTTLQYRYSPTAIAVDATGNVYVVSQNNYQVIKFDPSGTFLTKWGARGSGDGQFSPGGAFRLN